MEQFSKQSIKQGISDRIKKRELKMKPRIYFLLGDVFLYGAVILAVFFSVFFVSFILFTLKISGFWFLLRFGLLGFEIFIFSFPWLIFLAELLSLLLIAVIVQNFEFSWKNPLLYTFLAIFFLILISGVATAKTSFHQILFEKAGQNRLPVVGNLYRRYGLIQPKNTHMGKVLQKMEHTIQIESQDGQEIIITIPENGKLEYGKDIEEDDLIMIIGERKDETIKAVNIRRIEGTQIMPSHPPPKKVK